MGQTIQDGTGSQREAKVDDEHRLRTLANVVPHPQHHSMTHRNLFMAPYCAILQGPTETPVSFFKNIDSTIDFEFYLTQYNSDSDLRLNFYFGAEYTSGGDAVDPLNMNRGSGLTLPASRALIYRGGDDGDLVLNLSNATLWHSVYLSARRQGNIDFQGGLILTNNQSVSVTATGVANDEACMIALCSYHDAGTEL
jgi:hypothetical protein